MWYSLIFVLVVFIAAFVGFSGYSIAKDNANQKNSAFDQLSRIELNNQLEKLPDPTAWQEPVSAMCYDTAAPMERIQYVCPVCGEMTLYSYEGLSFESASIDSMPYYRNIVKKITKLDVRLDESQFCHSCTPKAKSRKLCIIVKSDNNKEGHKTCDLKQDDLTLLYEYSEGLKEHTTWYNKVPLNNYKSRIEELIGSPIDEIK